MTDEMTPIPLNKLVRSKLNMRKTNIKAGAEEMQASLLARGVLQNLVVYETANGKFAVAAGERRRSNLAALAKAKKIPGSYPVPCRVCSEEEA
ncbi:MAG: ParB/Srx family N-terminal domain-containing protein, partial [Acidocella sp.]|nr:ParB/Srx family N-terminal domain-containing protein [Acidocella sp.]